MFVLPVLRRGSAPRRGRPHGAGLAGSVFRPHRAPGARAQLVLPRSVVTPTVLVAVYPGLDDADDLDSS